MEPALHKMCVCVCVKRYNFAASRNQMCNFHVELDALYILLLKLPIYSLRSNIKSCPLKDQLDDQNDLIKSPPSLLQGEFINILLDNNSRMPFSFNECKSPSLLMMTLSRAHFPSHDSSEISSPL